MMTDEQNLKKNTDKGTQAGKQQAQARKSMKNTRLTSI